MLSRLHACLVLPRGAELKNSGRILDALHFWRDRSGVELAIELVEQVSDAQLPLHRGPKQTILFIWPEGDPPSARDRSSLRFMAMQQTCLLAMKEANIAPFCRIMREFHGRVLATDTFSPEMLSSGIEQLKNLSQTGFAASYPFSLTEFEGLLSERFKADLRAPVKLIADSVDALETFKAEPSYERSLRIVRDATGMLLYRIIEMLDNFENAHGEVRLNSRPYSIRCLLQSIEAVLTLRASMSETEFLMVIDEKVPSMVCGDPERFGRALLGLIERCLVFSPRGGILVHIETESSPENEVRLLVTAANAGTGTPDHRDSKLKNSNDMQNFLTQNKVMNCGDIKPIFELLQLLGGSISVRSEVNKGSAIRLSIPIKLAMPATQPSAHIVDDSPKIADKPHTFLVVDDNEVNRRILETVLRRDGHEVLSAANGAEAVALYENHDIALILMDYEMPILDGLGASKKIRELDHAAQRYTPIVLVTTYRWEEICTACQDAGIDGFVPKPVNFNVLRQAIHRALQCRAEVIPDCAH